MSADLPDAWRGFLASFDAHRPDLYRYCRHLTKSAWDAEDLAQDTLARAFVTLAQMHGESPPNPRAWLFRVASNLWIDQLRKARAYAPDDDAHNDHDADDARDPRALREAAGTLLAELSPQERAAVVLKDVIDLSLEETAEALSTTVGAIKAALHRGRGKLADARDEPVSAPAPALLDAFCSALNAGDIDALTALLLERGSVEVVGATTLYGREAAKRTVLFGMLFGPKAMLEPDFACTPERERFAGLRPTVPRAEPRFHRGRWFVLHWYDHDDGEHVRAVTTLDLADGGVARLRNYFYNPELVAEICGELGVPFRSNGRRWWP